VVLVTFGGITMFLGAYLAVLQVDLKRILAFTTVSALGTLVMLIGIGTEYAFTAMIVFLVVHSLYKGALFMIAGAIDHESGTRDISGLGGLFRVMPFTGVAAALAALSMSGFPPFYGFIGKEYIYDATLKMDTGMLIVTTVAVLSNMLMIVGAGMVAIKPFYGEKKETPKKAHEAPLSMWLGPATLAVLSLFLGLAWTGGGEGITLGSFAEPLSNQAVGAIAGQETHIHLYLIPDGISTKVILSTLTILVGTLGYFYGRAALWQSGQPMRGWIEAGPERAYTNIVDGMQAFARWQTKTFQGGYLRYYMLTVVTTVVGITALALLTRTQALDFPIRWFPQATLSQWFIAVVMLGGAIYMTQARTRLAAVVGLGAVGLGMSLVFVFNSAPDLAMTQFSIETLSVILFVLVLYRLPEFSSVSSKSARIRDAVVALSAGALMTFLVLAVNSNPAEPLISPYFAETSYEIAHGRNVVNVILVDYRALDTLGEITVLAIAALGIFALLKLRPPRINNKQAPVEAEAASKDKEQEQA
jgi:multicomponent Na+:H+ antiporter subunit A